MARKITYPGIVLPVVTVLLVSLVISNCAAVQAYRETDAYITNVALGSAWPKAGCVPTHGTWKVKHVPPGKVGRMCNSKLPLPVYECVKIEDGLIVVILPEPEKVSPWFYNWADAHAACHVAQIQQGDWSHKQFMAFNTSASTAH